MQLHIAYDGRGAWATTDCSCMMDACRVELPTVEPVAVPVCVWTEGTLEDKKFGGEQLASRL